MSRLCARWNDAVNPHQLQALTRNDTIASMVCMTVCSLNGIPEFHEFQPIGGSMVGALGALQPAATTPTQHARIKSRRTVSAWHRFLAMTVSGCVSRYPAALGRNGGHTPP